MLTKTDLSQIKKIVDASIVRETTSIKEDINYLKTDVVTVKKDVKSLKKNIRYIKKTIDVLIPFFNKEDVNLQKRVSKIEDHLGIPAQS